VTQPKPIVYLVGAGPGDPGLLTLRGKECLEQADFVLFDQLVSPRLLEYAPVSAERVCVRELASCHPDRWPHIHARLIEEARKGKCVVRLKGGDPLIFGRGGEEAEALRDAGIPYEIVPGVTAALAAGAYLEVPLTHRNWSSAVALVTGHEQPGKPSSQVDWEAIARFPGTVVIYMGFSRLGAIVPELIRLGKPPDTPVAAVSRASCGDQQTVTSTLERLERDVRCAGLTTPAVVIIGDVVGLRPAVSWFEARPLLGRRVLVTRPRQQSSEMGRQLELLGASPVMLPAVEVRAPLDWSEIDAAQEALRRGDYSWLVFTSANGVEIFMNRLHERGRDGRDLTRTSLAAIGAATAARLRDFHLHADVFPTDDMNAEGLLAVLAPRVVGQRVLLATADRARETVRDELARVARLDTLTVYQQSDAVAPTAPAFDLLRRGEIDIVTLTSPNIARAFLTACDDTILGRVRRGDVHIVTSNPRTSAVVAEFGVPVAAQSRNPTSAALLDALRELEIT
jgi:uroporphyrinogen III methyltransferase / synthase